MKIRVYLPSGRIKLITVSSISAMEEMANTYSHWEYI